MWAPAPASFGPGKCRGFSSGRDEGRVGYVVVSRLVGHRSYAMKPRQSRQVRKEATVTGRFVRSELPVSGFCAFGDCSPAMRLSCSFSRIENSSFLGILSFHGRCFRLRMGAQIGEACIEEKMAMQTTGLDESGGGRCWRRWQPRARCGKRWIRRRSAGAAMWRGGSGQQCMGSRRRCRLRCCCGR